MMDEVYFVESKYLRPESGRERLRLYRMDRSRARQLQDLHLQQLRLTQRHAFLTDRSSLLDNVERDPDLVDRIVQELDTLRQREREVLQERSGVVEKEFVPGTYTVGEIYSVRDIDAPNN